jgi:hypothetical protein
MMNRIVRSAAAASIVFALSMAGVPAVVAEAAQDQAREERERQRQDDRTAQRLAREAREAEETLKEVQEELDEFVISLLGRQYEDPFLQDYVNELGQSLVPKETPPGVLFSFRVIDDIVPNAMALPDGRIFLTSGLLLFVENEAQLAMILGHEIGHVTEQHYVKSVRARKRAELLGTITGAIGGAVLGSIFRGKRGAAEGAAAGAVTGLVVAKLRMNDYSRQQEDEADRVGTLLAMDRGFDSREAVGFFQKLSKTYGERDRFSHALYARHSRNRDRIDHIEALLAGGDVGESYNRLRSEGSLSTGTGQMYLFASRMMRDVAIDLMDEEDRYVLAKATLEKVVEYRSSDPRTLWALGRVYKLVARTDTDRARALSLLQRAAELDQRNLHPYTHRELGLMQARLGQTPAAVDSIKKYILAHISRTYQYPPDLDEMYDYLLTFGDHDWTAPAVEPTFIRATAVPPVPSAPAATGAPEPPPASRPIAKPPAKGGGDQ